MKKTYLTRLGLAVLALLAVGLTTLSAAALPQQQTNLLENPGFEQPYSNGVANGWSPWARESERQDDECLVAYYYRPKWNIETGGSNIRSGAAAQYIGNNWDTWSGGVYQTVPATPGVTYRFTFYGKGRGSNEPSPTASDFGMNINMRAGIDPNGSGNWADSDVVWGGAGSPHDQFQQFSVEATATGDQITVFTYANWAVDGVNQCRQFLDTWYDDAQLVEAGPPPTNTPPPPPPATATPINSPTPAPTNTPEATATPENTPTPEPSPTPEGGTICVNAFNDENANGLHEANEGYIAGVTFTIANDTAVVGQVVSNGTQTPECVVGLPAGTYQVAQTVPGRLEMTTAANATIQLDVGQTVGLEFGSRIRPTAGGDEGVANPTATVEGAEATPAPEEGGELNLLTLSGLGVILLGVVLLGGLLFMLLRRH